MATVARKVKQLWRRSTWHAYEETYSVTDPVTNKEALRTTVRYRRLQTVNGQPLGVSLRHWARISKNPEVQDWAQRKGLNPPVPVTPKPAVEPEEAQLPLLVEGS